MKYLQSFLLLILLCSRIEAQQLGPTDTFKLESRTFGDLHALTQQMNGFGSSFFFNPQQINFDPIELYQPGLTTLVNAQKYSKPLTFSALPHLGFGYGFGAQGAQRVRVDFEQAFAHQLLLNLRYDRWQRTGFIRADDLRYSHLQINLYQVGKRHEVLLHFSNASDDRQWAGGLADYTALGTISMDLLPVVKETSRTQKNSYSANLDFRYRLFGDSLHAFNLASQHQFQLQKRLYMEEEPLSLYYPQTYFSPDSSADAFDQSYLDNRLGFNWHLSGIEWSSLLGLRQRMWSDAVTQHDTLEVNWSNLITLKRASVGFAHQNEVNLSGAAQGWHANTNYNWRHSNWKIDMHHRVANEWPLLIQRGYQSNLTNYFWTNPQKQFFQELKVAGAFQNKPKTWDASLKLSLIQFRNVYRFNPQLVQWTTTGAASTGQFATLDADIKYTFGKALEKQVQNTWTLRSNYRYLAQKAAFLPKNTAAIALAWQGGVFKDKRLKVLMEAQLNYVSASKALIYLPYMESLDWSAAQIGIVNKANLNAQFNLALEVKTFRFFVNVANLGSYWNATEISTIQGYPFPTMQMRLGLTWDFWN
jgi:hypothetical protein